MKIVSVAGSSSDVVTLAAMHRALEQRPAVDHVIVHTGRDDAEIAALFEELEIPGPAHRLDVGDAPHGVETGLIMQRVEPMLADLGPDVVLVYGAANAAVAVALVAAKLGSQLGHVEAGLRGGARTSEINEAVTDRLADPLFVPARDSIDNLRAEGIAEERIHFVGSLPIDTLRRVLPRAEALDPAGRRGLAAGGYAVAALQPSATVKEALTELSRHLPVVDLPPSQSHGYLETVGLVAAAALVVTDVAALQEATSYLGVPCLTVGSSTDRPATCRHGTNRLVAAERATIVAAANRALTRRAPAHPVLERWDGNAAERVARVLCDGAAFPADGAPAETWAAASPEPALIT